MILFPTRQRPHLLRRFVEAYHATKASEPICLIIDHDDDSYNSIMDIIPAHWHVHRGEREKYLVPRINALLARFPDAEYYAVLTDDLIPRTVGWDIALATAAMAGKIASFDDGYNKPDTLSHVFLPGRMVRALGWFFPPCFKHFYGDNVFKHLADDLGAGYRAPVVIEHMHFSLGKAAYDSVYAERPAPEQDRAQYERYMCEGYQADLSIAREALGLC
jgi:hypothetical protein